MKKINSLTILVIVLGLTLIQCKKKNDPEPAPAECTNTSGTKKSFMPNTTGTKWVYKGASSYTTTVGCDTTINGKLHTKFMNSKSTVCDYFNKTGSTYTFKSNRLGNLIAFKDQPIGTTWTNNYPNLFYYYDYQYVMTVDDADLTMVVDGVSYSNVKKIKQDIFIDAENGFGYELYETDYYYYAYGVGLILSELEFTGDIYLDSYVIK